MTGIHPLNFKVVDDVAFMVANQELGNLPTDVTLCPEDLGPLLELLHVAKGNFPPPLSSKMKLGALQGPFDAIARLDKQWISPDQAMGVFKLALNSDDDEQPWTQFCIAMHKATIASSIAVGPQLVAAAREMRSNICDHSSAANTGLIAFRGKPGSFEFVVCDAGIGALKSLQTSQEYSALQDDGQALQLMLQDGVSRFAKSNRGHGFSLLFNGLANISKNLRFRSGDQALIFDGMNPQLLEYKLSQKAPLPGVFACVHVTAQSSLFS